MPREGLNPALTRNSSWLSGVVRTVSNTAHRLCVARSDMLLSPGRVAMQSLSVTPVLVQLTPR